MRLTRATVTRASRVMLPAHVLFSAWLGAGWMLQGSARTAVPALSSLRAVWPIESTGIVLFSLGVLAALALLLHQRVLAGVCLSTGALAYLVLAGFVAWPLLHGVGSFSAPAWPLYVATAHFASMLSVVFDEGNPERTSA